MTEYASKHILHGDRPLRRDIRFLSWELRLLVRRYGGNALWQTLDDLRELAERRQSGDTGAEQPIADLIATQPVDQLAELTRAIGLFFDLANLAEDRHRVRVLRQRERIGKESETIRCAVATLEAAGANARAQLAKRLSIEPVLTAHPTEAKRRSSRRAIRRLRGDLYRLDRRDLPLRQRRQQLLRMQRDLSCLWYTDPISPRRPSVMEELKRTLFAVRTLWRVTPEILSTFRRALGEHAPTTFDSHSPLRFGSWIGGDRDGNPFVTAAVTRRALQALRATAVRLHRQQCQQLRQRLTVSAKRAGLSGSLKKQIERARQRWPGICDSLDRLHPDEWLVQWLEIIDRRLARSKALPIANRDSMAYTSAAELMADVDALAVALREAEHVEILAGTLGRWRDRIAAFGLHLLRLDIRVNSTELSQVIDTIMNHTGLCDDYASLDEQGKRSALTADIPARVCESISTAALPAHAADLWALFRMLHQLVSCGGQEMLGNLIVSMTHQPSDVLAAVWLLKLAALHDNAPSEAPIPAVPLFETISDLERSGDLLIDMLSDPAYLKHVRQCGGQQICMIGYSDSAKDGGYLASNWALYSAQERLGHIAREHGVELTIFHGRGGAIGRGGGPAARAIHSLPPEAVDGRLRLTEQGEVIAERYDDPAIASRHLEQLFWATLTVWHHHGEAPDQETRSLVGQLAQTAQRAYRDLVKKPEFIAYQRDCTALPLIETLRIGSRPSRRNRSASLSDLRAIPFTFAWNQTRLPINAFYGIGAGFASLSSTQRQHAIELYGRWSWFRAIIDNAALALARCDPAIAKRYAALAEDPASVGSVWTSLHHEFELACDAVLQIKRQPQLLSDVPWLQRTIRVRMPYLDLLNLIQIELASRRATENERDEQSAIDHALRGTVQAIAAGLRNTG